MRVSHSSQVALAAAFALVFAAGTARAGNAIQMGAATLDRPTVITLGVRWALSGDDDFNASVAVRYRVAGTSAWRDALPLVRVRAELVTGAGSATPEFAGSIFDLAPATTYDIELTAHDPDGGDATTTLSATTRAVPASEPAHPHPVSVTSASELQHALDAAQPGDVITLAAGTYRGEFILSASGTATDPIVIRGVDRDAVILDGEDAGSNVLSVDGSYTHVERLTLQHDTRALRFHGSPATANVVRRVHARDVVLGFGSNPDQTDFYICDNVLEGRLTWPQVYSDDDGAHANDDGIHVEGDGHVVCHNSVSGFGDALKVETVGARADDFYGNDVNDAYDNAIELDQSQGNARAFRNRFTNCYMPISFQPIFGGPAYAIRNLVLNAVAEQVKIHNDTVGLVILNNTFMSSAYALQVEDDTAAHAITMKNNLWIGPATPQGGRAVNWDQPMDPTTLELDWNGWYPDGQFHFGFGAGGATYDDFAAVQAGGRYEAHGQRVDGAGLFADGRVTPASYTTAVEPFDGALASGSDAIDHGTALPNVTDGFTGAAPDLGAQEYGCASPRYGVRPEGVDERNEAVGCQPSGGSSSGGSSSGSTGGGSTGGGSTSAGSTSAGSTSTGSTSSAATSSGSSGGGTAGSGSSSGCGCAQTGAPSGADLFLLALSVLALAQTRRRAA